jgi:hypothetical protein
VIRGTRFGGSETIEVPEWRLAQSARLRWLGFARVVAAANAAGITTPRERYRFVAERVHGMQGPELEAYLATVDEGLANGTWPGIPERIRPEDIVGEGGAALMRRHGLYPEDRSTPALEPEAD